MAYETNDSVLEDFVSSSKHKSHKKSSPVESINFDDCKRLKRMPMSVYLKPNLIKEIEERCDDLEVSQSRFVEKILEAYLQTNPLK